MAQPVQAPRDVLGETLGSLLGELAWNEIEQPPPLGATRATPSWRPTAVPAAQLNTPSAEALTPAMMAPRPWSMTLDALAGRLVRETEKSPRETTDQAALASRVEARPTSPAVAPWTYVLQCLAGKETRPAAAAASETAPRRWKSVAMRSPGETIDELIGSVDWT